MVNMRAIRLAEVLKEELSHLFQKGIKDPRISYFAITDIEVSGDLKVAKIYVTTIGDKNKPETLMAGLEQATGFLRTELGKRLSLRYAPELRFLYDNSIERSSRIYKLLNEIKGQEHDQG